MASGIRCRRGINPCTSVKEVARKGHEKDPNGRLTVSEMLKLTVGGET